MDRKRWLGLFVENEIGVLARITSLFSGKSYNLDSLTVGTTEDSTISRITIGLTSNEQTFEQIKKQLNRSVEIVKVVDYTDTLIHRKELMFVKINGCKKQDMAELFKICEIFNAKPIDYDFTSLVVEITQTEKQNNNFIALLEKGFPNQIEVVRGGSVVIEAIDVANRQQKS